MKLSDFDFDLPDNLIAQSAMEPRDHSKLMVLEKNKQVIEHKKFYNISDYLKKGDVLGVARIAGIMGAKKTAELIPLCHLLNLTKVEIDFEYLEEEHGIRAICHTACTGRTGVEMEALTGVNTALLTIYDMCKAIDKKMILTEIYLDKKVFALLYYAHC